MKHPTLAELQKMLDELVASYNQSGLPEFEGLSPGHMSALLYDPFGEACPVQLKTLGDEQLDRVPMLRQMEYLAGRIRQNGEMKLTAKGFLPVKIVADLYAQGFLKDEMIEQGFYKLYKESDAICIRLAHILLGITGVVSKRKNALRITRKGHQLLADRNALLRETLLAMGMRFNMGYFDGYNSLDIAKVGFAFTFLLLHKYGNEKRIDQFYADRYLKAYPALLHELVPSHGTPHHYASRCYSMRTFDRFLQLFGLVQVDSDEANWMARIKYVTRTPLFDTLVYCEGPAGKA